MLLSCNTLIPNAVLNTQMQMASKLLQSTGNHLLNLNIIGSTIIHQSPSLYAYMNVMLELVDKTQKLHLLMISFRRQICKLFSMCFSICCLCSGYMLSFYCNFLFYFIGPPTRKRSWLQCNPIDWSY